jgi:hypothetical protein
LIQQIRLFCQAPLHVFFEVIRAAELLWSSFYCYCKVILQIMFDFCYSLVPMHFFL